MPRIRTGRYLFWSRISGFWYTNLFSEFKVIVLVRFDLNVPTADNVLPVQ